MAIDSGPRRTSGRALVLGAAAGALARGPSLASRTPDDERLIVGGAALMGALAGAAVEELAVRLGRRLPGGRPAASAALAAAGPRRASLGRRPAPAASRGRCRDCSDGGRRGRRRGARRPSRRPGPARRPPPPVAWVGRLVAMGTTELVALKRRLGEPQDLVKASVTYDYLQTVSVGEGAAVALESLDREGRKFLGLATPAARIAEADQSPRARSDPRLRRSRERAGPCLPGPWRSRSSSGSAPSTGAGSS